MVVDFLIDDRKFLQFLESHILWISLNTLVAYLLFLVKFSVSYVPVN